MSVASITYLRSRDNDDEDLRAHAGDPERRAALMSDAANLYAATIARLPAGTTPDVAHLAGLVAVTDMAFYAGESQPCGCHGRSDIQVPA